MTERRLDDLEIALSFSETGSAEAKVISASISDLCRPYFYGDWLDMQTGLRVRNLARQIYGRLPCIVLATSDWHTRPATILECSFMSSNQSPKLIFDFSGNFQETSAARALSNCSFGLFLADGTLDLQSVRMWILKLA